MTARTHPLNSHENFLSPVTLFSLFPRLHCNNTLPWPLSNGFRKRNLVSQRQKRPIAWLGMEIRIRRQDILPERHIPRNRVPESPQKGRDQNSELEVREIFADADPGPAREGNVSERVFDGGFAQPAVGLEFVRVLAPEFFGAVEGHIAGSEIKGLGWSGTVGRGRRRLTG